MDYKKDEKIPTSQVIYSSIIRTEYAYGRVIINCNNKIINETYLIMLLLMQVKLQKIIIIRRAPVQYNIIFLKCETTITSKILINIAMLRRSTTRSATLLSEGSRDLYYPPTY